MSYFYNNELTINDDIYAKEFFMKYEEDTYDVLDSEFLKNIDKLTQSSEVHINENENRFDLLSYKFLANTDLWWILMEYNNYIDFNINSNQKIKIPRQSDIISLIQQLRVKENLKRLKN